ncbi:RNA polymerase sigma-70 factor, ECF subfamily [Pseudoxanthobacter soli DSM 19599]|uniref:RNA polymerase sigma-70 factor, ECF subfamily n=1 Tax=Pseudoxanthobacter soli DSM 19599 TaxID=1123029 RepID=A0A1M7ZNH2_9HYPH|nr:RNA polymerase sigma factor [Pseudoxanthobacter soli]SHO66445.1 RNA polymerase sigma-70 factor, ECF subfamily [Pseudoxanthobacter soli DSM 19599]
MTTDMLRQIEPLIPALRRYARALVRNRAEADDLVQDCLERAIRNWHRRRDGTEPRAWLFTILHNLAINGMRQAARRRSVPVEDAGEIDVAHPATQESGLHYRDVMTALSRLPEDQRAVILLVAVEDLSYAETAGVLGVPIGTVMSRLSRARQRLHLALSEDMQGSPRETGAATLRRVK